ncbi:hypothetical protein BUALT_Bualt14G0086700 [Buddleja alternifolia]|uniref:Uncharacterized protein n=1 Tax=Buddleja alternifolia TaxID=168488 RepID=A0AAV6WIZ0_9LAMI|nr:hypothetical protein BUALT_Bualt14G0086700 [Buddleja alternifolia]
MGGTAKMNAMRSAVVVVGALAFGYLTLQLGFKPYLEKAQLEQQRQEQALLQAQSASRDSFDDSHEFPEVLDSKPSIRSSDDNVETILLV